MEGVTEAEHQALLEAEIREMFQVYNEAVVYGPV